MSSNITRIADSRTVQRASAGRKMNKAEAQELTAQIRQTAGSLWQLVAEAYDRKAWQALGYTSWKDYAAEELQMSESRSYQLVDTGRVMRAIAEVAGDPAVLQALPAVTARETARIKPHLTTFKRELKQALKDDMPIEEAIGEAIYQLPAPKGSAVPRVIDGELVDPKQADWERRVKEAEAAARAAEREAKAAKKKVCSHCHGTGYV